MTFADQVIAFTGALRKPDLPLPDGFDWLFPYDNEETMRVLSAFYQKYYNDQAPRTFIFGINPGRFGAGVTGVPFTDPVRLQEDCGIANNFPAKAELSAQYVWRLIHTFGGPDVFCSRFYITSLSPLGFVKDGKNINYYDDRALIKAVEPFILRNIRVQMDFGAERDRAFCLGEGQNYKFFSRINTEHGFFREIVPVPHPRWVMQYRRKQVETYIQDLVRKLGKSGV